MSRHEWKKVGAVPPLELRPARLGLHWAAQIVAAVGDALVRHQPDDSHASMEATFIRPRWLLCGMPTDTPTPVRAALDLSELEIVLLDGDDLVSSLSLAGKSLAEGMYSVAKNLSEVAGVPVPTLSPPTYELPDHEIRTSARFRKPSLAACGEISSWFANAATTLAAFGGPLRVWPHHFDMAVLESLDSERSLNTGFSPGDEHYEEPYFYVSPWPHEGIEPEALPSGKGHWHREGFLAAVLTGTEMGRSAPAAEQQATVTAFLEQARAAARTLLSNQGDAS